MQAVLREHLHGAFVDAVEAVPDERILLLRVLRRHPEGDSRRTLVAELFGSSRNLILLDAEGRVLSLLREAGKNRPSLRIGNRYEPPAARSARADAESPPFSFLPAEDGALSARLERYGRELDEDASADLLRERLLVPLRRRLKKDERLREQLASDVERAQQASALRRKAEVFQMALSTLDMEARTHRIADPDDPAAPPIEVELRARETKGQALDRMFREAEKAEAAWARASSELGRVEERCARLRSFLERVEAPGADPDALAEEAERTGLLGKEEIQGTPLPRARKKPEHEPRLPYRTFTSKDGIEILVGRTAADNDELTFRIARGSDVWLHVADYSGSHVVVRADGEVPEQTLLDAAALALHFSKAPPGSRAAVSWTKRKHVRKFRGAAPGQVQLAERRTLHPRDPADRLSRLLGKGS